MRGISLPQNLSAEGNILGDIIFLCVILFIKMLEPRDYNLVFL